MPGSQPWHKGRQVVFEGPVTTKRFFGLGSQDVHLVLLEGGVLVLSDPRSEKEPTEGVSLAAATIKGGADGGRKFWVGDGKKSFTFHCSSDTQRDQWLSTLLEAKLDAKAKREGDDSEACVIQ